VQKLLIDCSTQTTKVGGNNSDAIESGDSSNIRVYQIVADSDYLKDEPLTVKT